VLHLIATGWPVARALRVDKPPARPTRPEPAAGRLSGQSDPDLRLVLSTPARWQPSGGFQRPVASPGHHRRGGRNPATNASALLHNGWWPTALRIGASPTAGSAAVRLRLPSRLHSAVKWPSRLLERGTVLLRRRRSHARPRKLPACVRSHPLQQHETQHKLLLALLRCCPGPIPCL